MQVFCPSLWISGKVKTILTPYLLITIFDKDVYFKIVSGMFTPKGLSVAALHLVMLLAQGFGSAWSLSYASQPSGIAYCGGQSPTAGPAYFPVVMGYLLFQKKVAITIAYIII